ncbi:MAG: endolytic transglycosylase MltG, partial [Actinomycetota bacterium]
THITREEFLAAATPATARPSVLPPGIETLEGFLYPKTYRVLERAGAEDVVRQLVDQFEKEAFPSPLGLAANFDLTEYQILVIASLIEEEAKADEERAKISSVIHNRLRRGMKLEIDATVQYAVKKYGQPLTVSDLQVDSPYNTRKFPGLPPTPISSPGIESVEAAVEPAGSDALYYVLTADCTHHFFTASYDEFLREKAQGCLRP